MKIVLHVLSRSGCPHRAPPNGEWGPQVPTCAHPDRRSRGGDPWCPNGPNQRTDDIWRTFCGKLIPLRLFPRGCPLREGEEVTRG